MALPAIIGGIGALLGGLGALKSSSSQKKAAGAQANIAKSQQGLFNQTAPQYSQYLQMLQNYANTGAMPGMDQHNALRMQQGNEQIGQNLSRSQDQLSFGLGRRGLTGSSLDVAGRAALLANANNQRSDYQRQLQLQAPMEFERRMALLGNSLNPGLGAGQIAGNTFGNQAQMYGQQAGQGMANVGGSIQNFMMYDALRRAQQQQGGGGGSPIDPSLTTLQSPNFVPQGYQNVPMQDRLRAALGFGNMQLTPMDFMGAP
jgi:hypothetical protein